MSLSITFTEPATVNTTGHFLAAGAVYDSGHSTWVYLGFRSPTSVSSCQTSPTGAAGTWTMQTMPSSSTWRAIDYASSLGGAGRLVAVGNGVAAWSDDGGTTWAAATSLPEANNWIDVKWWAAKAMFVAVAGSGTHRVMTSTDGKSWTVQTAAAALTWSGLAVSATTAVAVAFSSSASTQLVMTSTDGAAWTLQTHTAIATNRGLVSSGSRLGIGYSDTLDMFLIAGNDGTNGTRAWRSTNGGVTWTASNAIPTIGDSTNRGHVWLSAAGSWYMSAANFNYVESTDGITWTATALTTSHSGYTPVGWDNTNAKFLAGSTLGFDTVLIGAVVPLPTVTRVVPSLGRVLGGKLVTIYGTRFSGTPTVTFGGTPATNVVVLSSTRLIARTPAHAAGLVTVDVGGGSLANAYRYTDAIFGDLTIRQEQGITIEKELNDAPDQCTLTSDGVSSVGVGAPIQIVDPASGATLFGGTALVTTDGIDGTPAQAGHQGVLAGDLTWRLNALRPFGTWNAVSASVVYQDLIDTFAPQFTGLIEAGLPTVSITCNRSQTLSEVFSELATLAQCSWRPDDNFGIEVFTVGGSPLPGLPPDPVTDTTPLYDPLPSVVTDITQVRNRIYVKGAGTADAQAYEAPVTWTGYSSLLWSLQVGGNIEAPVGSVYAYTIEWFTDTGATGPITPLFQFNGFAGAPRSFLVSNLNANISTDPRVIGRYLLRTKRDPVTGGIELAPDGLPKLYRILTLPNAVGSDTYLDTLSNAELTTPANRFNTTGVVFAMEENVAAQTALAALLNVDGGTDDGVREGYIEDATLMTSDMAIARAQAELALFAYPIQTVTYACRDEKSVPGQDVSITLTKPPVSGVFKIQSVRIDQIQVDAAGALFPRFHVTASSLRFTLDDLLRGLVLGGGGTGGTGSGGSASGGSGSGSSSAAIYGPEVPTGVIGGSPANSVFSTARMFTTIWVFKNGLLFTAPTDYTVTGPAEITMVVPPVTGDSVVVYYL